MQIGLLSRKWPQEQFSQATDTGIDLLGNLQKSGFNEVLLKIRILDEFLRARVRKIWPKIDFHKKPRFGVSRATFAEKFGLMRFRVDRSRKSGQDGGFGMGVRIREHRHKGNERK